MPNSPLLDVHGLGKRFYVFEQDKHIPSAADVHLRVESGRMTSLLGPTGSGKSTVLKCIYRTYLPTEGCIMFRTAGGERVDLAKLDEHGVIQLRHREIRFVTQFLQFLPRQPTLDVVASPLQAQGCSRQAGRQEAARLLRRLAIPERLWNLPPATFSGGERQRVNLARGVIARPRLLLLDEPTASLDPATMEEVVRIIEEIKRSGTGILAVFHDMELVERLADSIVRLKLPEQEIDLAV